MIHVEVNEMQHKIILTPIGVGTSSFLTTQKCLQMEKIGQCVYCNCAIKTLCPSGISFAEGLNRFKGLNTANAWIFSYLIHCDSCFP